MIRIIADNGVVIEAATVADLGTKLNQIFKVDPVSDVILTYVLTQQPTSRRKK